MIEIKSTKYINTRLKGFFLRWNCYLRIWLFGIKKALLKFRTLTKLDLFEYFYIFDTDMLMNNKNKPVVDN